MGRTQRAPGVVAPDAGGSMPVYVEQQIETEPVIRDKPVERELPRDASDRRRRYLTTQAASAQCATFRSSLVES